MAYSNFKPTVWSASLLANFAKRTTALGVASLDYQAEVMRGTGKVRIIVPSSATVKTYNPVSGITYEEISDSYVDLDINQQRYVAIKVEDIDQAQSHIEILDALVGPAGRALAVDLDSYIYGLADGFTTGAGDVELDLSDPTDNSFATGVLDAFTEAAENLDNNDAPRDGRFVVASPRLMRAIVASGDFTPATAFGDSVLVNGVVGRVAGFDVIQSNNTYKTTDSDVVNHLFYGVRGSIAAAVRLGDEPEPMRLQTHFADAVRMLTLYGAKIIRPEGLGLLKVTEAEGSEE
jgi:hypothetical protein